MLINMNYKILMLTTTIINSTTTIGYLFEDYHSYFIAGLLCEKSMSGVWNIKYIFVRHS